MTTATAATGTTTRFRVHVPNDKGDAVQVGPTLKKFESAVNLAIKSLTDCANCFATVSDAATGETVAKVYSSAIGITVKEV